MSDVDMGSLDRRPIAGIGVSFYCRRVTAYVTKSQCVDRYLNSLQRPEERIPCRECAKVLEWAGVNKKKKGKVLQKENVIKKEVERIRPVSDVDNSTICIDFTDYMELLNVLNDLAKRNFRTPDRQILSMIQNHVHGKGSHKGKVS